MLDFELEANRFFFLILNPSNSLLISSTVTEIHIGPDTFNISEIDFILNVSVTGLNIISSEIIGV